MRLIATITLNTTYLKLWKLCKSGITVFRLNFSHIDLNFQNDILLKKLATNIDELRKNNFAVEVAVDNRGPEIRTTKNIICSKNEHVIFSSKNLTIDRFGKLISDHILIDDSKYIFKILNSNTSQIITMAQDKYNIRSGKSLNIFFKDHRSYITREDIKIFQRGLELKFRIFFLSFIRNSFDMKNVKNYFSSHKVILIAKIESIEAVNSLKSILKYSNGYMIARGDLFMNLGYDRSYRVYKQLLKFKTDKIKLTATGYATNLIKNQQLSQSEIVDISYANEMGCDGMLLSNETVLSENPEKVVSHIRRVIKFSTDYYYTTLDENIMLNTPIEIFSKKNLPYKIEKYNFKKILRRNYFFYK